MRPLSTSAMAISPAPDFPARLEAGRRYRPAAPPPRLRYGDPSGSPELRTALQGYLWRARGLRCEPDQIIVVNGSQQGLDLCARLLLDPGDPAVMENPCYAAARRRTSGRRCRLIPRAVDREGMRTERAARRAAGLRHAVPPVPARQRHVRGPSAGPSRLGAELPGPTSSRTTTTASTASTSPRSRPCRPWMAPERHLSRHGLEDALADPAPRLSRGPDGAERRLSGRRSGWRTGIRRAWSRRPWPI